MPAYMPSRYKSKKRATTKAKEKNEQNHNIKRKEEEEEIVDGEKYPPKMLFRLLYIVYLSHLLSTRVDPVFNGTFHSTFCECCAKSWEMSKKNYFIILIMHGITFVRAQ